MAKSITYNEYKITQQVNRFYGYIDGVQTGFDSLEEAQDAIDAMIERRNQIKKNIGRLRSVPFNEAWQGYLKHCKNENKSEHTIRNYGITLNQIKKHKVITETKDLTRDLFVEWLNTYTDAGTKRQYYNNLCAFVRYCMENNHLIDAKILDLHYAEKKGDKGKRAVNNEEILKINEWLEGRESFVKIFWRIGLETGIRIGDIVKLKRAGLDTDRCIIRNRAKKTDKVHEFLISNELLEMLKRHIASTKSEWLVCKPNGERYTTEGVQTMFKRMRDDLKLPMDISFNSSRKRMSNITYAIGGPAVEARVLGHTPEVALTNYVSVGAEMDAKINAAATSFTTKQDDKPQVEGAKRLEDMTKEELIIHMQAVMEAMKKL
jgi:integrase